MLFLGPLSGTPWAGLPERLSGTPWAAFLGALIRKARAGLLVAFVSGTPWAGLPERLNGTPKAGLPGCFE
jgi:hypothetical protein